jgi:hypothetical protein
MNWWAEWLFLLAGTAVAVVLLLLAFWGLAMFLG